MEELSLEDLAAQLQAAQQKKAAVRLSERNVVELVNKLMELGFLDKSLLHTINGKEYLTHEQLRKEIKETLNAAGGRISLSEVCNALNVDLSHCEKESAILVSQSNGAIRSIQEELITEGYLDSIAVEIKERLGTTGMLRIGDLAIQYGLSHDLLLSVVSSRLGSVIQGELLNSMLYTQAYMERLKAQLRGALRGTTSPVMISALLKCVQLDETGATDIIQKLIHELVDCGDVKGELKSNGQWVPEVHLKAQRMTAVSAFHQNGWMTIAEHRKANADKAKEQWNDAVKLNSVVVSTSYIESIDAEIEETIENKNWCNVPSVVPADFSEDDVRLLIKECSCWKRHSSYRHVTDTFLVNELFVEDCRQKITEWSLLMAKQALSAHHAQQQPVSSSATAKTTEESDSWADGKGKGKKKGRAKNKGKGSAPKQPDQQKKETGFMNNCPTKSSLRMRFVCYFQGIADIDNVPETLSEGFLPEAVEIYNRAIQEATTPKSTNLDKHKLAVANAKETLNKFWLFSKGLNVIGKGLDEQMTLLLKKHIIKTTGYDTFDWLLRCFQFSETVGIDVPDKMVPISQSERSKIIRQLDERDGRAVAAMLACLKQDDPEAVLEGLDNGLASYGLMAPFRDRRSEKQMFAELRATWKERLMAEGNAATVLALTLPLLISQLKGVAVSMPGRAMPAILDYLKPLMAPDEFDILTAFHKAVVQDLRNKSSAGNAAEENSMEASLSDLLPKTKALVRD